MRVYLFFLSCFAFLQLKAGLASEAGEEEDNINPFELARQLRIEICAMNRSQIQDFYKAQRDEENRDRKFPGTNKVLDLAIKLYACTDKIKKKKRLRYSITSRRQLEINKCTYTQ